MNFMRSALAAALFASDAALFASGAALFFPGAALAQYPSKPVTFIVPFAAGGDSDLSGRNVAQHAQKHMNNQPFVVVNRVGASGSIGARFVREAAPDGYTLLVARIATHSILPALDSKTPYKWNDFTLLSLIELNPYVCVVKGDSPLKSVQDLYAEIRSQPGKLNFSTAGIGTSQNMAAQYLLSLAGLKPDAAAGIHYKGGGEVTTAVLGAQVHFACNNAPTLLSHIRSGALRGLFVTTRERLPELTEVPTAREAGVPDMEKIVGWTGLVGPPGLPKEVVDKWVDTFQKLARDPDWQAGNARLGGIAAIRSPAETERFMREQFELYDKLITTLGIRQ